MRARELMTENPDCVTSEDTLQRAASLMRDRDIGAIPVVSDNDSKRLIGMVTDRDIATRHVAEGHGGDCKVEEAMSRGELATAREDDDVEQVMELMKRHKVRRVPVVRENDEVVGMIAQADLAVEAGRDRDVEKTVEKISEPAQPQR